VTGIAKLRAREIELAGERHADERPERKGEQPSHRSIGKRRHRKTFQTEFAGLHELNRSAGILSASLPSQQPGDADRSDRQNDGVRLEIDDC
jgi:hypothetical protein